MSTVRVGEVFTFKNKNAIDGYANHLSTWTESVNHRMAQKMRVLGHYATMTVVEVSSDGLDIKVVDVRANDGSTVRIDARALGYDNTPRITLFSSMERAHFLVPFTPNKVVLEVKEVSIRVKIGSKLKFKSYGMLHEYRGRSGSNVNYRFYKAMIEGGFDHESIITVTDLDSSGTIRGVRVESCDGSKAMEFNRCTLGFQNNIALFVPAEATKFLDAVQATPSKQNVVTMAGAVACSFATAFQAMYGTPVLKMDPDMSKTVKSCQSILDEARATKKRALAEIEHLKGVVNKADEDIIKYTDALVGATYIMTKGSK